MKVGGIDVVRSFLIKVCRLTVSKALDMSRVTAMERSGGALLFNPWEMCELML